jgi:hypothetical protein
MDFSKQIGELAHITQECRVRTIGGYYHNGSMIRDIFPFACGARGLSKNEPTCIA